MTPFLDGLARQLFGRTKAEAHRARRCLRCWSPVDQVALSHEDRLEYRITAFCPLCVNEVAAEPVE